MYYIYKTRVHDHDLNHMTHTHEPNAGAALPVPDSDCLIIRTANNPWVLIVEECRSDVVEMPQHGEETLSLLVVPHLWRRKYVKYLTMI